MDPLDNNQADNEEDMFLAAQSKQDS